MTFDDVEVSDSDSTRCILAVGDALTEDDDAGDN